MPTEISSLKRAAYAHAYKVTRIREIVARNRDSGGDELISGISWSAGVALSPLLSVASSSKEVEKDFNGDLLRNKRVSFSTIFLNENQSWFV